jgi:hypothetical protein
MVSFAELRDAKPEKWMTAANDLRSAADKLERAVDEIHDNGTKKVEEHWEDHLGAIAKDKLVVGTTELTAISIENRGAATLLDTLSHTVSTAQRELHSYIDFAQSKGLTVTDTGQVVLPPDATWGDYEMLTDYQGQAQRLINEVVEAATQADGLAKDGLKELDVDNTPPPGADQAKTDQFINDLRDRQAGAVSKSLNEIRDLLPDGLPPEDVAKWWGSLNPADQEMFKKAVPLDLYDLPGVPQPVKDALDDKSRGYSTIGVLRYARDHANDSSTDHIDGNKCTDFVSSAMHFGGGLPFKDNGWGDLDDTSNWVLSYAAEHHWPGAGHAMTHTWGGAENNKPFFQKNGADTYPVEQARPGDALYWSWADGPDKGQSHHAAIATAVLPDGEVLYAQHESNAYNYSLQDRKPYVDDHDDQGASTVVAVRPRRTW